MNATRIKLLTTFAGWVAADTVRLGSHGKRTASLLTKRMICENIEQGEVTIEDVANVLEMQKGAIRIWMTQYNAGLYDNPDSEYLKHRSRVEYNAKVVTRVVTAADMAVAHQEAIEAVSEELDKQEVETIEQRILRLQGELSQAQADYLRNITIEELNGRTRAAAALLEERFTRILVKDLRVGQEFMTEHGRILKVTAGYGGYVNAIGSDGKTKRFLAKMTVFVGK